MKSVESKLIQFLADPELSDTDFEGRAVGVERKCQFTRIFAQTLYLKSFERGI